ncbi:MAG: FAD-dependent oxidoreductase, partial [Bacteroidia bacterium]|nr:FAD-dependent oxidoreductase [Bacteroidia bacterium]
MKTHLVTIVGAGLGGLATALRLSSLGYRVRILEKYHLPGGRLNLLEDSGFRFDMGPSFFSMSYEFDELFRFCGEKNPLQIQRLNPIYQVFFRGRKDPFRIYTDIERLEKEFSFEKDFRKKFEQYLAQAKEFFHDTENVIVKQNFDSLLQYFANFFKVPLKHTPYLFKTMWANLESLFEHEETKVIFSLVAFFLGSTPFETPAVYSLLNYTELKHDGYWSVRGGMYSIVEAIVALLRKRQVEFIYQTEIVQVKHQGKKVISVLDKNGKEWTSDI